MKRVDVWMAWLVVVALVCGVPLGAEAAEKSGPAAGKAVNINAADLPQLTSLPGIGPKIAQRILDFRKTNGAFKKPADLMKVKGIGAKLFDKIQPLVVI
jgi:competence protein ComEA